MSDQTKQLCDSINSHFDEMVARIRRVREAVAAARLRVARAVQVRPDEANQRAEGRDTSFQKERLPVIANGKGDLADAETETQRCEASHDAENLARHADQNEQYALVFILTGFLAIDAAEVAALRALDARLTAEEMANDDSANTLSCQTSSLI